MRFAVVNLKTDRVVNIILASPDDAPPDGCVLVAVDNIPVNLDFIWNGSMFFDPEPYAEANAAGVSAASAEAG